MRNVGPVSLEALLRPRGAYPLGDPRSCLPRILGLRSEVALSGPSRGFVKLLPAGEVEEAHEEPELLGSLN